MGKISTDFLELDTDIKFEGKNNFAKNYDTWRKKEELNKLKSKYGEDALDDNESSSSDDDENGVELTEEVEKDFFKTLSYLKKKDPKIYDRNVNFFKPNENAQKIKKSKNESMFIKDYERKLILENGGVLSDEEEKKPRSPTYVEEQNQLKEDIKNALSNVYDDENEIYLTKKPEKHKVVQDKNTAEYKQWLAGKADKITNDIKTELKPLKEFWNDPNLDDGEKFLRDYILNKKYLDNEKEDYIPSYEEIVHDSDADLSGDEEAIEQQEEFEHKYNFRFEEPDHEFIKRYPRTIEKSLRKTNDHRKIKRAETKVRKQKEKDEKMAEIQKLKELKRKEIEEKIEKLKEITGNTDVGFQEDDIEEDFDPQAYDKRMKSLFNDDYYEGPENEQKPEFPEVDEELEIENWDNWNGENNLDNDTIENEPHCEDDNFNMDADFDPLTPNINKLESTKARKKMKRKSKVAEALSKPKPKYDSNDKDYAKYFDEYYELDCEDIIGDIPCRFKYREVVPNDFGLSVEEILLAKDRELNKWCSLKKMVQHRPEHVEKYDQIAYSKKATNIHLKKKILPSLFSEEADETEDKPSVKNINGTNQEISQIDNNEQLSNGMGEETKKSKKNRNKQKTNISGKNNDTTEQNRNSRSSNKESKKKKRMQSTDTGSKKKKFKNSNPNSSISDARLSAYGINPKKFKNKLKYGNKSK